MREVLVVCPQERDLLAVAAAGLEQRYDVRYAGSDLDAVDGFDAAGFVAACSERPPSAVVATKDRSALLASVIAERLGLAGPRPSAVVACQHKPTSRRLQRLAIPEATPDHALLDGGPLPFEPPFFVKPVVGRLSQNARAIVDPGALVGLEEDDYPQRWSAIAALAGIPSGAAHGFLLEELLTGAEVTLEAYVHRGRMTTIGVTDSLKYPRRGSFERFEYPARLSAGRSRELDELAARLVDAIGFDDGFFNVEFFVPVSGPAKVIEINARLASQFAPLVLALHGRSTYDALFELACGDDPRWRGGRPDGVAISYCLRAFEDAFVAAVPEPEEGLEVLVRPGLLLSEQGTTNDAESYRLAIFHETGETRDEVLERCRVRAAALPFELRAPASVP
jgi:hypothetical protein